MLLEFSLWKRYYLSAAIRLMMLKGMFFYGVEGRSSSLIYMETALYALTVLPIQLSTPDSNI